MLPQEIVFEILSKLPSKTLVRFRCVSKLFCAIIADHAFGVLNRSLSLTLPSRAGVLISIGSRTSYAPPRAYYTLNFTPRRRGMLQANRVAHFDGKYFLCSSSSDGLFICVSKPDRDFTVCNVRTGQRIFLPRFVQYRDCALLLGFDSESKRYKVLMSSCLSRKMIPTGHEYKHWVFTVGVDKTWREISNYCSLPFFPFEGFCCHYSNTCVYIDDVIYSYNSLVKDNMIPRNYIVAFEVGCESFSVITLPKKVSTIAYFDYFLKKSALLEIGGRLAIVRVPKLGGGECLYYMNVWTWEKSKECWEEITMTIPLKWSRMISNARLLRFATNHDGEIVLLCIYREKFSILICNLKSEVWRKFDVSGVEDFPIFSYWDVTIHNFVDHVFPLE
nr:putative F-box protein At3g52320 [Ipomoea batatas]GMD34934.1 putative F-box protein At3g52320 [Ipomoea batatas]